MRSLSRVQKMPSPALSRLRSCRRLQRKWVEDGVVSCVLCYGYAKRSLSLFVEVAQQQPEPAGRSFLPPQHPQTNVRIELDPTLLLGVLCTPGSGILTLTNNRISVLDWLICQVIGRSRVVLRYQRLGRQRRYVRRIFAARLICRPFSGLLPPAYGGSQRRTPPPQMLRQRRYLRRHRPGIDLCSRCGLPGRRDAFPALSLNI